MVLLGGCLLGGCYCVSTVLLGVAMVLLFFARVLLGGCYGVARCLARCCPGFARWLLGVARWLLWCS